MKSIEKKQEISLKGIIFSKESLCSICSKVCSVFGTDQIIISAEFANNRAIKTNDINDLNDNEFVTNEIEKMDIFCDKDFKNYFQLKANKHGDKFDNRIIIEGNEDYVNSLYVFIHDLLKSQNKTNIISRIFYSNIYARFLLGNTFSIPLLLLAINFFKRYTKSPVYLLFFAICFQFFTSLLINDYFGKALDYVNFDFGTGSVNNGQNKSLLLKAIPFVLINVIIPLLMGVLSKY